MPKRGRPPIEGDMLQGTLDVLVLKTLALGAADGHTDAHAGGREAGVRQGPRAWRVRKTLARGPAHGHTIAHAIEHRSEDVLQVEHGSLYPALHRIEDRGWIASFWGTSQKNRKARYYRLTPKGRRQLETQTNRWDELVRAVNRILRPAA